MAPDDERHDTMPTGQTAAADAALPIPPQPPEAKAKRAILYLGLPSAVVAAGTALAVVAGWAGSCVGHLGRPAIAEEAEKAVAPAVEQATAARTDAREALRVAQEASGAAREASAAVKGLATIQAKHSGIQACSQLGGKVRLLTEECHVPRSRRHGRPAVTLRLTDSPRLLQELAGRSQR